MTFIFLTATALTVSLTVFHLIQKDSKIHEQLMDIENLHRSIDLKERRISELYGRIKEMEQILSTTTLKHEQPVKSKNKKAR